MMGSKYKIQYKCIVRYTQGDSIWNKIFLLFGDTFLTFIFIIFLYSLRQYNKLVLT